MQGTCFLFLILWFATLVIQAVLKTGEFTLNPNDCWFEQLVAGRSRSHTLPDSGHHDDDVLSLIKAVDSPGERLINRQLFFVLSASLWISSTATITLSLSLGAVGGFRSDDWGKQCKRIMFPSLLSGVLGFAWSILKMEGAAFKTIIFFTIWPLVLCLTGIITYISLIAPGCQQVRYGKGGCKKKSMLN